MNLRKTTNKPIYCNIYDIPWTQGDAILDNTGERWRFWRFMGLVDEFMFTNSAGVTCRFDMNGILLNKVSKKNEISSTHKDYIPHKQQQKIYLISSTFHKGTIMEVTRVRLNRVNFGKVVAMGNFVLGDAFACQVKVIDGTKGLFISLPSQKKKDSDEYENIAHPITKELQQEISTKVLEAYNNLPAESAPARSATRAVSQSVPGPAVEDDDLPF